MNDTPTSPVPSAPREPAGEPTPDLRHAMIASRNVIKALRWELTRAKSALENWGRHHGWCASRNDALAGCNCGLETAIANITQASAPRPDVRERQQATNAGDSKLFTELHLICAMREAFAEALCMASNHDKGAAVAVSCLPCWKFAERRFPISARPDVREEER